MRNEGYRTAHLFLFFKHLSSELGLLFSDGGPDAEKLEPILEELQRWNEYLENHVPYFQNNRPSGPEV